MLAHVGNVDHTILLIQLCKNYNYAMMIRMQEKIPSLVWNSRKMIQSYLRCNKHEGYQFSSDWWNAAVSFGFNQQEQGHDELNRTYTELYNTMM
jgi:uncharacterized protein YehS (DUF1456 family)